MHVPPDAVTGSPNRDPARPPLLTLLARAGTAITQRHRRAAAKHGLTATALAVLGILARGPGDQPGRGGPGHRDGAGGPAGDPDTAGAGAAGVGGAASGPTGPADAGADRGRGALPVDPVALWEAGEGVCDGVAPSHRELAACLGVVPATLTPVVDALEQAGAVRRVRDDVDRRLVRIAITPVGRGRFAEASPLVAAATAERMPQPSPDDEAVVRAYLLAVLAAAGEEGGDGPSR